MDHACIAPAISQYLSSGIDSFALIGRRHLRDNSWMHNVPQLMRGTPRCTLFVHPADAARLALSGGREAIVHSLVGEVRVPVTVTDEIMRGVVSYPTATGIAGRA